MGLYNAVQTPGDYINTLLIYYVLKKTTKFTVHFTMHKPDRQPLLCPCPSSNPVLSLGDKQPTAG